jgi:hypothetical protein
VSVDQLESPTPGLVSQARGKATTARHKVATIFADHASGLTYVHNQPSTSGAHTVAAKEAFERYARTHGVDIKHYHADNGRFADVDFMNAVRTSGQGISFCGVGAHHQNGVAEKRIRDLTEAARTSIIHASHRWPTAVNAHLWPYALRAAAAIRNLVPPKGHTRTPIEAFSGTHHAPREQLKHMHPFGCPIYVLEDALQKGNSLNRWDKRSRVGIYLGQSEQHATSVALVLNLITGNVSPQFHVVFDDKFDTVTTTPREFASLWQARAKLTNPDSELVLNDTLVTPPPTQEPTIPRGFVAPWYQSQLDVRLDADYPTSTTAQTALIASPIPTQVTQPHSGPREISPGGTSPPGIDDCHDSLDHIPRKRPRLNSPIDTTYQGSRPDPSGHHHDPASPSARELHPPRLAREHDSSMQQREHSSQQLAREHTTPHPPREPRPQQFARELSPEQKPSIPTRTPQ